jgi:hypothetical protein
METLVRIKRAVLAGNVVYTTKAELEMEIDRLLRSEVEESIVFAGSIYKTIRSSLPGRGREYLHVIHGTTLGGTVIYTKGKLVVSAGIDTYYVLVSGKRAK